MSETVPRPGPAAGELPPAREYDPAGGDSPFRARVPGTVVLMLAGEAERDWAADAAMSLAGAWAGDGRRIVLADLHLEDPVLHERAGTENLEGVADVFLYGASIARSAKPVPGRDFYLIPAGTYAPDPEAVYRHPRWPKLAAGFRDASAALVLFAPAEAVDGEGVGELVDQVVLLGDSAASSPAVEPLRARGVSMERLVPPGAAPPRVREPGAPPEPELMIPPPPARRVRRSGRGVLLVLGVLVAAAALAALGYYVAQTRPELVPWGAAAVPSTELPAPREADRQGASRSGDALPYSVQVKAFPSLTAAREQIEEERARFPAAQFFISPEEIQGIVYHKILAGLEPDTAAAGRLREQLVETGLLDPEQAAGSWSVIQFTPLAFDLGEFDTAADANTMADSLAARDVPAYAVPVPYADGTRRWQLYGGAYRDSSSAEAMRERLEAAGIRSRLVARIGEAAAERR